MNTFKDYYKEFYNSNDILLTLVKYDKAENVTQLKRFIKYLVWNMIIDLKGMGVKAKFTIPPELKLYDNELNKNKKYLDLRTDLKIKTDTKSFNILQNMVMFYNTDAMNIIPLTGKILPVTEELRKYYKS